MWIYLTERFEGEPVRVTVDGAHLLDLPEARTEWSTGLAGSAEAAVTGRVHVVAEVPSRGLRAEHTVEADEDRALLVRLEGDQLTIRETSEPVRFM